MAQWRPAAQYGYIVGKRAVPATMAATYGVLNKHTGEVFSHVSHAPPEAMQQAMDAAHAARPAMQALAPWQRKAVLDDIVAQIDRHREKFATAIVLEAGKTITDARGEVTRALDTFALAANEAVRIEGDCLPLAVSPATNGLSGITRRFPVGVVGMITPFNFPLNLTAHKVAPAIAAGCPFILKPSDRTPISALLLGEIMSNTDLPDGSFSVLPCENDVADLFTKEDKRVQMISFTGSPGVGWYLKNNSGRKKVLLELGGNAPVIVDRTADIDHAVARIAFGAFYYAGQTCISAQRVYVMDEVYDELKEKLAAAVNGLNARRGDPFDADTFLSPMISEQDVERVQGWVKEAVEAGGSIVAGGGVADYCLHDATLLENVPATASVVCKEVFGPVCVLQRIKSFEEGVQLSNDSEFGLQAGVFTNNFNNAFYAFEHIEAGGVVINDVSTTRSDAQPYGGVKSSGIGREGVKNSLEEFSELRCLVMRDAGKTPS
eukprot:TRINITY_DN7479_c0_g1_i1.p1 TRINITY_DN7479_c0_g1~~TRINITY_DN7479_c0_g1_i1.p1  ORF type:complete len:491 (-),score=162.31 TRINITY_DN7479_c0_g1_i1:219-1691(-)